MVMLLCQVRARGWDDARSASESSRPGQASRSRENQLQGLGRFSSRLHWDLHALYSSQTPASYDIIRRGCEDTASLSTALRPTRQSLVED